MITGGNISIFIGNPIDGVSYTFVNICVLSSGSSSEVFGSNLLLLTTFNHSCAIINLEAKFVATISIQLRL